jgi:cardiolipin synthase
MDRAAALARVVHPALRGLARAGVPAAARLSPDELAYNAYLLSCAALTSIWQARQRGPSWEEVSRAWERALDGEGPTLHGRFAEADRVDLVTDNREAFALRSRLHASARRSIDLSTYYLKADEIGRAAARELSAAAARGVRVRLVADETITLGKEREAPGLLRLLDELRAAGVAVRLFRDRSRPWDANHRKLLIVDGEAVLLGGRNVANHYAGSSWRDVELLLRGPSARQAEAIFDRTFTGAPEPAPLPGAVLYATTPADLLAHAGFVHLLRSLRAARRTVDVENAYFFGHPAVVRQIAAARRRGVRVRVLTNSRESNDLDYANYRLSAGCRDLLRAGAELWLREGAGRTLHSKYFVVDGELVGAGSANLDYYSPRFCAEVAVQVRSAPLGAALTTFFEEGLADGARRADAAGIDAALASLPFSRVYDALLRDTQ